MKEKRIGAERGTILVETALAMPLLLLLFIGIFEFGKVLMVKQVITNAAREGARAAAIKLDNTEALSSARQVSQDYLARCGVDLSVVTVTPVFSTINGTGAVQVTIHYNYLSNLYRWVPGIPETIGLESRVVMRREA